MLVVVTITEGFISPFRGVKSGPERLTDLPETIQLGDGGKDRQPSGLPFPCMPACLEGQQVPWAYLGTQNPANASWDKTPIPEGYLESRSLQGTLEDHPQMSLVS